MSVNVAIKNACKTTGEGPHWDDATQTLLFVDILEGDVARWNPATDVHETRHVGVNASLIVPSSAGGYIISVGHTLGHLNWDSNTYTQYVEVDHDTPNRFNDGKCDATGRLWAGTMGPEKRPAEPDMEKGSLYTLDSKKNVVKHLSKLNISNGLAWPTDNQTMYFIDSVPGKLVAFDFDKTNGTISNERMVRDFSDRKYGFPDGMTIDIEDKLWVACYSAGKIIHIDPTTGKILREVNFPASRITSCSFGGQNLDELYVTCAVTGVTQEELKGPEALAGSVFKVTGLGAKGRPAYIFQE